MQTFSLVCCGNPQMPWRKDMNLIHKGLLFTHISLPERHICFIKLWSIPSKNCEVFDRLGHVLNTSKTFKVLKAI